MEVQKLAEGSRKLSERVNSPIRSSERSQDLAYARSKLQYQQSQSNLNKEEADYIAALNERNQQGYFGIEDETLIENQPDDPIYSYNLNKEESEYLAASEAAKQTAKKINTNTRVKLDISSFDKNTNELLKFKEESKEEQRQMGANKITEMSNEFNQVLASKPSPIGKTEDNYFNELDSWIVSNKPVLEQHYKKSVQVLSGDIKLNESQQTSADYVSNELANFATFKGANSSFSQRILNTPPKYAYISPAGAPAAIAVPYFEGEYSEFDPASFTVTTKESTITRWNRLGMPMTQETVKSKKGFNVSDPFVKEYIIQKNMPKWGFQGNYSQDAANIQKRKITNMLNAPNKNVFSIITPIITKNKAFSMPTMTLLRRRR